jgi:hypothetical protein
VLRVFGCDEGLVLSVGNQSSYMCCLLSLIALATRLKLAVLKSLRPNVRSPMQVCVAVYEMTLEEN